MTIERKLSFSESRQRGQGFIETLLGKRKWEELPAQIEVTHEGSGWRTLDGDTLEIGETLIPANSRMYGTMDVFRYRKGMINNHCKDFRWHPDNNSSNEDSAGEILRYQENF